MSGPGFEVPKVKVSLCSIFMKEFLNFSHFRSLLTLVHLKYKGRLNGKAEKDPEAAA